MYAIVLLTVKPTQKTIDFFQKLKKKNYDLYICVDDNDYILPNYDKSLVNIIKFDDEIPKKYGYYGSVSYCENRACSRDKALYYFCEINKTYDYVWHIEDDVFIPSIDTIKNIDLKYPTGDLLSASNQNYNDSIDWYHWYKIENKIEKPWYRSMICAIRTSRELLKSISQFVSKNKYLLFCEVLFNTIAMHNNLKVINPPELKYITWKDTFKLEEMNISKLYHPVKDIDLQYKYRTIMNDYIIDKFTNINYIIPYFRQ